MSTVTKETFWTQIVEDPTLYGTITTDDNLFNYRSDAVWQVMNETFIVNGTNFEVTKWEELLGLDVVETTLNSRKAAILNHITENLPITIGILEQLIKELTDDDYMLVYDKTENKLLLDFPKKFENEIKEDIPRLIPIVSEVDYLFTLPTGYIAAEFLESTGTQYIKTSVKMKNDVGFRIYANALKSFDGYLGGISNKVMPLRIIPGVSVYFVWGSQYKQWANPTGSILPFLCSMNYKNSMSGFVESANYRYDTYLTLYDGPNDELWLFAMNPSTSYSWKGAIYWSKISIGDNVVKYFIPSLSQEGVPCMFDFITKTPFYNNGTGSFIVGLTLSQSKKLSNLPTTGGTLTISLPTGYDADSDVTSALETARSKGWTLTIQTYTPEASESATSTYGMRRIWVRKIQDENGIYVDANGNRFQVDWCVEIYSPENKTPEDLGYEQFRSVESAVEYWELTPYVDPTLEEQFNITNEEQ